jgi:NTE family protein
MSLSTIIHAGMRQYERPPLALVLMGGGARTAYQVGVLRALATLLQSHPGVSRSFPFQILVGTSAGAINAAFLAGRAREGLQAFEELAAFWGRLRSIDVYRLNTSRWLRFSRVALALEIVTLHPAQGERCSTTRHWRNCCGRVSRSATSKAPCDRKPSMRWR